MRLNWKPVNPDSRLPGYLQNHTKENMIWQLKLCGVFLIVMIVSDKIQVMRENKARKARLAAMKNPIK